MEIAYVWVLMSCKHGSFSLMSIYREQDTAFRVGNGFEPKSFGKPITDGWQEIGAFQWRRDAGPNVAYHIMRKPLIADFEV